MAPAVDAAVCKKSGVQGGRVDGGPGSGRGSLMAPVSFYPQSDIIYTALSVSGVQWAAGQYQHMAPVLQIRATQWRRLAHSNI